MAIDLYDAAHGGADNASFMVGVYRSMYGRNPDPPGFNYWLAKLNAGEETRESVWAKFAASPDQSPDSTKTLAQYLAQYGITAPGVAATATAITPVTTAAAPASGISPYLLWGGIALVAYFLLK